MQKTLCDHCKQEIPASADGQVLRTILSVEAVVSEGRVPVMNAELCPPCSDSVRRALAQLGLAFKVDRP